MVVLIAILSLASAGYGLAQTFIGFPGWDARWVAERGYIALNVGGTTRAFASFSAASEYATFLGLGIVSVLALGLRWTRWPAVVSALALLGAALWYEAARGAVVLTVLAVAVMASAAKGVSLKRSLVLAAAVLATLPWVVGRITPEPGGGVGSGLAAHQVQGLSDPFAADSSLLGHIELLRTGLRDAVRNPLGTGVGAVSLAAGKYGGPAAGTEADPSNAAVAGGTLGLVAYVAVLVLAMSRTHRLARNHPSPASLAALGFLVVTFLQWLNGGHYAVIFVPWLVLGWVDRAPAGARPVPGSGPGERGDLISR